MYFTRLLFDILSENFLKESMQGFIGEKVSALDDVRGFHLSTALQSYYFKVIPAIMGTFASTINGMQFIYRAEHLITPPTILY